MLKELLGKGTIVYIKNKEGKFVPIHLKISVPGLIISAIAEDGQYLGDDSLNEIRDLDKHLHNIGVHEKGECPNIDQTKRIIINLR